MDAGTNTYWLDESLRITDVNEAWDQFAQENDGDQALGSLIRGRPLWDFVVDDVTRMWLELLIKLARMRNEQIERPYRCDTPELKRYMLMKITPEAQDSLRVDHILVSTAPRIRPVHIHCAGRGTHLSNAHLRCSMCGRIANDNAWLEPDADPVPEGKALTVIYTVCNHCAKALEPEVGGFSAEHMAFK